jgi:hypothetical protein
MGVVSEFFWCAFFERILHAKQHENRQRRLEGNIQ